MDNMQDAISNILSDPDAMAKIQELGKSLGLTGNDTNSTTEPPQESEPKAEQENAPSIDLSSLASMLSGASSQQNSSSLSLPDMNTLSTIKKFLPLLSGMNQEDETTALLYALRPFLSDHRRKRLDDAGKMLRIMRVLPMIRSTGLF